MTPELSKPQATALLNYFRAQQSEILAFTKKLVETESPSGDAAGSRAVVSLLIEASLTIDVVNSADRLANDARGEHLRITAFTGQEELRPIVILGHTDTVHPRGSLAKRPWLVEGNLAYGPGVFDMKANCALIVEVMKAFSVVGITPRRPLVILLTCDEETGSDSGRHLVEAEAKRAEAVLVIEPPASGGRVKTGRKGTGTFTVQAHGRAAHAGLNPENGVSAILEIARQIERLQAMNTDGGGVSVNVGLVTGGTLSNVVPAEAQAEVDLRFSITEEGQRVEREIFALHPFDERVRIVVKGGINRPPLERTKAVLKLYEHARRIGALLDHELGETQVGGASDGNFAAAVGAPVLDGLGIDGDGAHASHEHINVDDIPRSGALIAGILATL